MGQQQLLLLVLGVVIVGIAVMAGFHAFNVKSRQFAADRLVDRNLTIAANAVFWKAKKDPFAGGNAEYTNFSLQNVALEDEAAGGEFIVTDARGQTLVITAVSRQYPKIGVRTYVHGDDIASTVVAYDGSITLE